jgi:hypothetical protein
MQSEIKQLIKHLFLNEVMTKIDEAYIQLK